MEHPSSYSVGNGDTSLVKQQGEAAHPFPTRAKVKMGGDINPLALEMDI